MRRTESMTGEENDTADRLQLDWIEKPPKVLCLQLNRTDLTIAGMVKHQHRVTIEKQIHIDRFLYKNAMLC